MKTKNNVGIGSSVSVRPVINCIVSKKRLFLCAFLLSNSDFGCLHFHYTLNRRSEFFVDNPP